MSRAENGPQTPVLTQRWAEVQQTHSASHSAVWRPEHLLTASQEPRTGMLGKMGITEAPREAGLVLELYLLWHLDQAFCRPTPGKPMERGMWQFYFIQILVGAFCLRGVPSPFAEAEGRPSELHPDHFFLNSPRSSKSI